MEKITYNVPIEIPADIVESGLLEEYALDKGWDSTRGKSAQDYLAVCILRNLRDDFKRFYVAREQANAASLALSKADQLLG